MLELKEESVPSLDDANAQEIPTIEITPDTEDNVTERADENHNEGKTYTILQSLLLCRL